jgi:CO/xanthine dehydrogenase Mo-binding subunit
VSAAQGAGVPFGGALGRTSGSSGASAAANTTGAADAAGAARGRTRVTSKAITRVATALGAEALGVSTRSVSVRLSDDNGMLAVTLSGPIRVPALNDLLGVGSASTGSAGAVVTGETILERCERAQQHIREVTASLTGAEISRVTVHLTGIETTQKERVQ